MRAGICATSLVFTFLTTASSLPAARPQVILQGGFVTPRSDLSADDALVWRARLIVNQRLNDRLSWDLFGDLTPATLTRPAGLWLYSGRVNYRLSTTWLAALGRQQFWNALHATRFDGIALTKKVTAPGQSRQLKIYAGVTPDSEIATGYSQGGQPVFGGLLHIAQGSTSYGIQVWGNYRRDQLQTYLGGSIRKKLGSLSQVADLALNLSQAAPEKIRLRTVYRLSSRAAVHLQYRYAGQFTMNPYTWMSADTSFAPRQVISAGGRLALADRVLVRLSLSQRLGGSQAQYLLASVSWGGLALAWRMNAQSLYEGHYTQLSARSSVWGKLKVGGSLGAGTYSRFDDHSPAVSQLAGQDSRINRAATEESTLAATAWVQRTGAGRLGYRLFTQYTRNRYFNADGRVGLQVTYAF
ncbi:MAG: hypothetical protein IID13_11290 [Candidatus Marinimicrobia bacterium]|nr:hypothetical protein [Candidatus Neomarinimicrobiota bacterium]